MKKKDSIFIAVAMIMCILVGAAGGAYLIVNIADDQGLILKENESVNETVEVIEVETINETILNQTVELVINES